VVIFITVGGRWVSGICVACVVGVVPVVDKLVARIFLLIISRFALVLVISRFTIVLFIFGPICVLVISSLALLVVISRFALVIRILGIVCL
jgi:hypothetical protein